MRTVVWGEDVVEAYDATAAAMFDPAVDVLAALAGGGPALGFAIGTGRVALPLQARGVPVSGIAFPPHMADRLRAKPGADTMPVVPGDMTTARVPGTFSLVYLIFNAIRSVTTREEQVAVFPNAARHRRPAGSFVVPEAAPVGARGRTGDQGVRRGAAHTAAGAVASGFASGWVAPSPSTIGRPPWARSQAPMRRSRSSARLGLVTAWCSPG
jgi:hypothetical protein